MRRPKGVASPVDHICANSGLALVSRSMTDSQAGSPTWRLSFALYLQSGLGYGALRAGLMFPPTVTAFGAVGIGPRRVPGRLHAALVALGFVLGAAGRRPGCSAAGPGPPVRGAAQGSDQRSAYT